MRKLAIAATFGVLVGATSLFGSDSEEIQQGSCLYDPDMKTASIFDESSDGTKSIHLRNPRDIGDGDAYEGDTSTYLSASPLSGQWERITVYPHGSGDNKEKPVCILESVDGEKRTYHAIKTQLPAFDAN